MALILPKGFVVNSPGVSENILRNAQKPMTSEEVHEFWKVYTTTKRRLVDPTAERLENLFWRIWGSRRRQTSAIAVANLFMSIEKGETFPGIGPLRSPAPRDESGLPSVSRLHTLQHGSGDLAEFRASDSKTNSSSLMPPKSSLSSRNINGKAKVQTTAMPPPILKKTRGQSSSGPKPTARFISPGISEDESEVQTAAEVSNHTYTENSHVVVRPPTPDHISKEDSAAQNTAPQVKKKSRGFVVAAVGRRKRPGISRRPSSQSSTGSDNSTHRQHDDEHDAASSYGSRRSSGGSDLPSLQENSSTTPETGVRSRALNPKTARHVVSKTTSPRKVNVPMKGRDHTTTNSEAGPSRLRTIENQQPTPPKEDHPEDDCDETAEEDSKFSIAREEEESNTESRSISSRSHRSLSAHNLSAAYRTPGRSTSDSISTKAPPDVAKAPADLQLDGTSDGLVVRAKGKKDPATAYLGGLLTTTGVKNNAGPTESPSQAPIIAGKPGSTRSAAAFSMLSSSSQSSISGNRIPPSRSVSNLTTLLQKDDEKKEKNRKERRISNDKRRDAS